jgi:hypothetical protein
MPDEARSGGDFPREPGLETRVAMLEAAVAEVRAELKAIRSDLASIRLEVAEIKGRLANMPTTFQLVYMRAAIVVAVFGGAIGLSFAPLRFAAGH